MLVLTRKTTEQIKIGNDITITILRVKGNAVRVGVDAPKAVRVIRSELPPHAASEAAAEAVSTDANPAVRSADPAPRSRVLAGLGLSPNGSAHAGEATLGDAPAGESSDEPATTAAIMPARRECGPLARFVQTAVLAK